MQDFLGASRMNLVIHGVLTRFRCLRPGSGAAPRASAGVGRYVSNAYGKCVDGAQHSHHVFGSVAFVEPGSKVG